VEQMCRWLAYTGSPVRLEELLLKPGHSLIDQSLHSRLGATTTDGRDESRPFAPRET
jgi:predicted glutamine amidotransferase